jgi:translocation and assembly module TamB
MRFLPGFPPRFLPQCLSRLFRSPGFRGLLVICLLLVALLAAACAWLLTTTDGLKFGLGLAEYATDGRLRASGASGRLLGAFGVKKLEWLADEAVTLTDLEIDWSPAALRHGTLVITRIAIARLEIAKTAPSPQTPPPERLTLPFALTLERLEIARLDFNETPLVRHITARLASDGRAHAFAARFIRDNLSFDLAGNLSGEGDLPLSATLDIDATATLAGKRQALTLHLAADGPLAALPVEGRLLDAQGGGGRFSATLTPFAAQPLTTLNVRIQDFDPSRWLPDLPQAILDVQANIKLADETLSGRFELRNKRPGLLGAHALPLETLSGNFLWQEGASLKLTDLDARFPGQGRYQGQLEFKNPHLNIEGKLTHIDPRRFMPKQLPTGDINASFHARLNLEEKAAQLDFTLLPGRLAGQSLQGQGRLRYASRPAPADRPAPAVQAVDLDLRLGPNRAQFKGNLGMPQDVMQIIIAAPNLSLPLLSGDLEASLRLSGRLDAPFIVGEATSDRLDLLNDIILQDFRLQANFNAQALTRAPNDEKLALKLSFSRLASAAGALRAGELEFTGSPRAHQMRLTADLVTLPGSPPDLVPARLRLLLAGGLDAPQHWSGALEASADGAQKKLAKPLLFARGALAIDARQLTLSQAKLQGELRGAPWQANIDTLAYPFDPEAPLQGDIGLQSDNLAWAAALLGPAYRAGGRLSARLKLAGTPAAPRWQGFLHGDALSFAALDLGLRLESGQLRLDFDENMLRLENFQFTNPHSPLPQKLDREQRESLKSIANAPGSVSGQGYLQLPGNDAADNRAGGQLEFQLDKLGVMQRPEQWLALSGTGRLQLAESQQRLNLEAKLNVDGGYWRLADLGAPRLSDDVIVSPGERHPGGWQGSGGASDSQKPLRANLVVDIDLGSKLYFVGAGVYSRLRGALRVQGQNGEPPRASGSIHVADGRFDAYGQRLDIEQGVLTFNGLVQNPVLNIRALRKNQAVEAGVGITGTAQKPVIRLISEPNVPDAEKLSWLVLGEAPDEQSGADYSTLLAAAQAILGDQDGGPGSALADLQQSLGVNISMGKSGKHQGPASQVAQSGGFGNRDDNTAQSQVVRVGARLADGLTLSYEQSLTGAESVLKLTYALTRRLSLVGQTGSDNALDLFYSFHFGKNSRERKTASEDQKPE